MSCEQGKRRDDGTCKEHGLPLRRVQLRVNYGNHNPGEMVGLCQLESMELVRIGAAEPVGWEYEDEDNPRLEPSDRMYGFIRHYPVHVKSTAPGRSGGFGRLRQ